MLLDVNFLVTNFLGILILFSILMFIFFDGIDLGSGIILPFLSTNDGKKQLTSSIHPFWDVNETWLIMAAVLLVMGFTNAYTLIISAFYVPIIIFLALLVFRGCAMEFRNKNPDHARLWDWVLFFTSLGISVILGVLAGSFLIGLPNEKSIFMYPEKLPIPLICGIMAPFTLAIVGSAWASIKTEITQSEIKKIARISIYIVLALVSILLIVIYSSHIMTNIINSPARKIIFAASVSLGFTSLFFCQHSFSKSYNSIKPLLCIYTFSLCCGMALLSFVYPFIIPYKFTAFDLARFDINRQNSPTILGLIVLLMACVVYYFWKNYRIFKGKISGNAEY